MSPNPKIYTRTPASHIPVLPPVVPPRTSTPVLPPLVPAQTPRPNLPPFRLIPPAVPTYDPLSPMSRHQRIITHVSPSTNHHHTRRPGPKTHFTPSSQNGTVSVEVFLFFSTRRACELINYLIRTLLSPSRARYLFSRSRREPGLSRHRGSPFAGSKHACGSGGWWHDSWSSCDDTLRQ